MVSVARCGHEEQESVERARDARGPECSGDSPGHPTSKCGEKEGEEQQDDADESAVSFSEFHRFGLGELV